MKPDNKKYLDIFARIFVAAGGILTMAWAVYYIVTWIKDYLR